MKKLIRYGIVVIIELSVILIEILDFSGWQSDIIIGNETLMLPQAPSLTLFLLLSLTAYLVIDGWGDEKTIEKLEREIIQVRTILEKLGPYAKPMNISDGMEYMANKFLTAQHSLDQAAISHSISTISDYKSYDKNLKKSLRANKVTYRYIAGFDKTRWNRAREWITNPEYERVFLKYFDCSVSVPPVLNFLIIDNEEVVTRVPINEPGDQSAFIVTNNPEVVKLFREYFTNLWTAGMRLDRTDAQKIEEMDRRYLN